MAKWGEGDPRWIVEERPDATNVNNWHWTEKNACQWSQDKIKMLLTGLEIEDKVVRCIITDIDKCEGEAAVNNRKGKLICFYEWDIVATWQCNVSGITEPIEGKVAIPNLSEENELSEIEVNFTLNNDTGSAEGTIIKEFLKHVGKPKVTDKLGEYIRDLREEFSKGLILPKKGEEIINSVKPNPVKCPKSLAPHDTSSVTTTPGSKIVTKNLSMSLTFQCTGQDIYNALTIPELVTAFTNGKVILEPRKGGKFELFGGNVHGTFEELVQNIKIVQRWRTKQWPVEHYSTVTMTIEQQNDNTVLHLVQTGIPDFQFEGTQENWSRYYWDPIKRVFGYGSFIIG